MPSCLLFILILYLECLRTVGVKCDHKTSYPHHHPVFFFEILLSFLISPSTFIINSNLIPPKLKIPGEEQKLLFFLTQSLFFLIYFIDFLQRGGERDRARNVNERETSTSCFLHTPYRGCTRNQCTCP
uniref:Secreted protein n=1 Tax=Pipistrellus kuhlii TaxID=59472 RepID=A0A7J7ZKC7_PIPKU|nr:hypothetical protein mPipKuh1_009615 [Pipistrellus kuhlii]